VSGEEIGMRIAADEAVLGCEPLNVISQCHLFV